MLYFRYKLDSSLEYCPVPSFQLSHQANGILRSRDVSVAAELELWKIICIRGGRWLSLLNEIDVYSSE